MAYDIGPRISITGEKEFNNQIKKINENLKVYGSELKAVSSQYSENEKGQEALIAKNKVLENQYTEQTRKIALYQDQLEKQTKALKEQEEQIKKLTNEFGENSVEVLKAKKNYSDTESNINKLKTSINETKTITNKLTKEINDNNRSLDEMEQGIRDTNTGLKKLDDGLEDVESQLKETSDAAEKFSSAFASEKLADISGQIIDGMQGVVEESKEYLKIMGSLETSSQNAGYSAEETSEIYKTLYSVLADEQSAATTTANLQALNLSQKDLIELTKGAIGAWAKYGDSIPIDGLAEAINETSKVGKVTGVFADVLNWAGTNEDDFNKKLENANTTAERTTIILEELANQGLMKSADAFRENNSALIEANEAQADYKKEMAELGETMMPIFTMLTEATSILISLFNSLPDPVKDVIVILLGLIAVFGTLAPIITAITGLISTFGTAALLPILPYIAAVIAAIAAAIIIFKNWDKIVEFLKNTWNIFVENIKKGVANISNFISKVGVIIDNLKKTVTNKFKNIISSAFTWGKDMIYGFVNGIKNSIKYVTNAVSSVAKTITSWLHFSRPDVGPLREYEKWMPDMMQGMAKGIHDNKWKVEDELASLSKTMSLAFNNDLNASAAYSANNNITLYSVTTLDGKVVASNTTKHVTNSINANDLVKGY